MYKYRLYCKETNQHYDVEANDWNEARNILGREIGIYVSYSNIKQYYDFPRMSFEKIDTLRKKHEYIINTIRNLRMYDGADGMYGKKGDSHKCNGDFWDIYVSEFLGEDYKNFQPSFPTLHRPIYKFECVNKEQEIELLKEMLESDWFIKLESLIKEIQPLIIEIMEFDKYYDISLNFNVWIKLRYSLSSDITIREEFENTLKNMINFYELEKKQKQKIQDYIYLYEGHEQISVLQKENEQLRELLKTHPLWNKQDTKE